MAPQVVATDELGRAEDAATVREACMPGQRNRDTLWQNMAERKPTLYWRVAQREATTVVIVSNRQCSTIEEHSIAARQKQSIAVRD